jgi:hypothetical protein
VAIPEDPPPSPYTPVFQDVFVVPEDLAQFAELVNGDLGALRDAWNRAQQDMNGNDPNFPGQYARGYSYSSGYPELAHEGDGGMLEGREFYRAYFLTLGAEISLMEDVLRGLDTLRAAAEMIHNAYRASDASNAGSMENAFAAYERSSVLHWLGEATDHTNGGTGDEQR